MTVLTCDWLTANDTQSVFEAFRTEDLALYCVGGCVRNGLLGLPATDIDMTTPARPDVVSALAEEHGFKAIPTGLAHGTVTLVAGRTSFEITTFRKDIETDGRRAVVAFSSNLEEDAQRRDFTINALYCDQSGQVIDPVGGLADLHAGRVRFIDDAQARIREDYLRILRFFRFFARFSRGAPDPDILDAIAHNLDGLPALSAERVTAELVGLLSLPDPSHAVGLMQHTGVLASILPGADTRLLAPLVHNEAHLDLAPDPMVRMAAMGGAETVPRLRLSKAQQKRVQEVQDYMALGYAPEALGACLGMPLALHVLALQAALAGQPVAECNAQAAKWGAAQRFPISASDLMPAYTGPALGQRLEQLRAAWLASGLTLTKDALSSWPRK